VSKYDQNRIGDPDFWLFVQIFWPGLRYLQLDENVGMLDIAFDIDSYQQRH
jgi:hypothetical protein